MKKIILFILMFLVIGCTNKRVVNRKEKLISVVSNKKEYYSYKVYYVDHDDIYASSNSYGKNKISNNNITENVNFASEEVDSNTDESISIYSDEEKENENNDNNDEIMTTTSNNGVIKEEITSTTTIATTKEQIITTTTEPKVNNENKVINSYTKPEYKGYYSPLGKFLGTTNVKVIDVSYYQGNIDWNAFVNSNNYYGVILRLGYWKTLDKKFERNISEVKRLNIPYGIYLFSYSSTINGAIIEADFTNSMIDKYNLNPTLGIYYDIESWKTNSSSSDNISKITYDKIIPAYINNVSNYIGYKNKVKVYSGRWYAMNRLGVISKSYVDWVAEYNNTCKYDSNYSMWQFTSKARVPGIIGNVDVSYLK